MKAMSDLAAVAATVANGVAKDFVYFNAWWRSDQAEDEAVAASSYTGWYGNLMIAL